jgi:hypothetical protein
MAKVTNVFAANPWDFMKKNRLLVPGPGADEDPARHLMGNEAKPVLLIDIVQTGGGKHEVQLSNAGARQIQQANGGVAPIRAFWLDSREGQDVTIDLTKVDKDGPHFCFTPAFSGCFFGYCNNKACHCSGTKGGKNRDADWDLAPLAALGGNMQIGFDSRRRAADQVTIVGVRLSTGTWAWIAQGLNMAGSQMMPLWTGSGNVERLASVLPPGKVVRHDSKLTMLSAAAEAELLSQKAGSMSSGVSALGPSGIRIG